MASGNTSASSQPVVGQAPQTFGPPAFSAAMLPPATQQPPAPVFPAPGMLKGPAPRSRPTRLIALGSVIALVVVLGGILLTLGLTRTGPFAPGSANHQATPTPTTAAIPAGFKLYTNKDHSFSIVYPGGWDAQPAVTVNGSGEQFSGPASQTVQVVHGAAAQASDVGTSVDAFCTTFSFIPASGNHTTTTLAGQQWTREECDNPALSIHAIVEAVAYKGTLYLLSYASPTGAFNSNRSRYFTPMEQSFTFLS
jgi:hypothetical protein